MNVKTNLSFSFFPSRLLIGIALLDEHYQTAKQAGCKYKDKKVEEKEEKVDEWEIVGKELDRASGTQDDFKSRQLNLSESTHLFEKPPSAWLPQQHWYQHKDQSRWPTNEQITSHIQHHR